MKLNKKDPRVPWAMERTYLAWVRTSVALMGFGFVVARSGLFLRMLVRQDTPDPSHTWSLWFGTALVGFGVLVLAGAVAEYLWFTAKAKRNGLEGMRPSYLGIGAGLALILLGAAMTAHLLSQF